MDAFQEWFSDLLEQSWVEPTAALIAITAAVLSVLAVVRRFIVGKAQRILDQAHEIRRKAEEQTRRLQDDVAALENENRRLRQRLPEHVWELVARERRDDNEESALRILRHHMEAEGGGLSEMARQISRFHLGLVTRRDHQHLVPAERFALRVTGA